MNEKICRVCEIPKLEDEFYAGRTECKACRKKYNQVNKVARRRIQKKYADKNREILKVKSKERYWADIEETRKRKRSEGQKWRDGNKDKVLREGRKGYHKNRVERLAKMKERFKTESRYRLKVLMSTAMRRALLTNKGGRKWEELAGYTSIDLMEYLKKTIPAGHTWEDFLLGKLHIDHKIPISAFNFSSESDIDFKRCFSLKNLQLLTQPENSKKSDKIDRPFQPSLPI